MRIAELSRTAGVPVPTIKYYLREGLLPAGELTSPNQARYGEVHERRLRLVRAMVEVGGMTIAAVRDVLAALDDPDKSLHKSMGTVEVAIAPAVPPTDDEVAQRQGEEFVARQGWQHRPNSPAFKALVRVLATAREIGHPEFADELDEYARVGLVLGELDVAYVLRMPSKDEALEGVVVRSFLSDAAVAAVRRLARRELSARHSGEEDLCSRSDDSDLEQGSGC